MIQDRRFIQTAITLGLIAISMRGSALGQVTQTLPRGYDSGTGGSSSAFPFNSTTSHIWQWHYDSAQFNVQGPIRITEVYVRAFNNLIPNAFSFPSLELVMASSPTDYSVAGNISQPGHALSFAANLNPDQFVVRPAAPWTLAPTNADWLPLGMTVPFVYDRTIGNDFVLQIRTCGTGVVWGQSIFGATGSANSVGGNRYGDINSCTATAYAFNNNEYVPIIRIDYVEQNLLTVSQSGPGIGDLRVDLALISGTGIEGFTLLSGIVNNSVGSGFMLGIVPEAFTWSIFSIPYAPGNPYHFRTTDPGVFPQSPFQVGPGAVSGISGVTADFVLFMLNAQGGYDSRSTVVRYTFQ